MGCPSVGLHLSGVFDTGLLILVFLADLVPCIQGRSISGKDGVSKQKERDFFSGSHHVDTLMWVVQLHTDSQSPNTHSQSHASSQLMAMADEVAMETGLVNRGQLGVLEGLYLLVHDLHNISYKFHTLEKWEQPSHLASVRILTPLEMERAHRKHRPRARTKTPNTDKVSGRLNPDEGSGRLTVEAWETVRDRVHEKLNWHRHVKWHLQETVRPRHVRSIEFEDPSFPQQWHLVNRYRYGFDINVMKVWERNVTGRGVTAAVVDDGLEWTNPDIEDNYSQEGSWDLNSGDADPMPLKKAKQNHHGTRCAGEIAAVANSHCGVGVAFGAKVAGIRLLDGPMTDGLEAQAFMQNMAVNDVYSCSWGPEDDGKTVDGPHYLARRAMRYGTDYGRRGYGAIYVVASGNGGHKNDNCNYDGYANSVYTITIGAVDEVRQMPYYAEECASMLAVTYSSGGIRKRSIVTTDWTQQGGHGCTTKHSGTSAAAPLAAGMIVLMLQARPCLTWRDVQFIIVIAAVKVDVDVAHWYKNAAGLHHSHKHGFGLMDAWRLVNAAKTWQSVPWMSTFTSEELNVAQSIPMSPEYLVVTYTVTNATLDGYNLMSLEYVHVTVTLKHEQRGDLEIRLRCPSKTESLIGATRTQDKSKAGFHKWTFSTVRCWGESPLGQWKVIITDKGQGHLSRGQLVMWQLRLYGSSLTTADVRERIRMVNEVSDGKFLYDNFSLPCKPPPVHQSLTIPLSKSTLEIIVLVCFFCVVVTIYESLEYILCYNEEKRVFSRLKRLVVMAQRLATDQPSTDRYIHRAAESNSEVHQLLLPHQEDGEESSTFTLPYVDLKDSCETTTQTVAMTHPSCDSLDQRHTDTQDGVLLVNIHDNT
ncbi:hypothetical protein NP493_237g03008 [Ridgeia piscesae]|uniref:P/Homo B domain-containing protein n=1 Tax=Ridgeia piscesae TaxID=27915 RepID=A0AAD9NZM7_RIDPI|nr:hypothetical protein NP493_237g03008 [Ridgeia piscesae]